ncbi:hypothetical protein Y032_0033g2770 [Ancylostoma ceylanicum]|uniref:MIR domain-containing protein n=1 Tax=Ancylostoma ceylanicum TaxID=53326 RepID=A0A016UNB0_9BILA|nr:hypothetical protein Y032_0033g2770 [Ancylostoma ceylanicum]
MNPGPGSCFQPKKGLRPKERWAHIKFEVSCFGNDAQSDTGDNWQVVCDTEEWLETEPVKFKHVDTGVYLALSGQQFGRPIHGQREVVGTDGATSGGKWKAAEGVFMKRNKE